MLHYALLFRASRPLSDFPESEQKQRTQDIQAWVKHVAAMGIAVDPKALGHFCLRLIPKDGAVQSQRDPADSALVNFVFFDAPSEEEAIEVARSHPGPHYGVSVELRDYTIPGRAANPPR